MAKNGIQSDSDAVADDNDGDGILSPDRSIDDRPDAEREMPEPNDSIAYHISTQLQEILFTRHRALHA